MYSCFPYGFFSGRVGSSTLNQVFPFTGITIWTLNLILYINSVSLLLSVSVCRGPETQITFNKTVPPNSRAQKLFKTSSSYFLFLFLRPFSHNNCRRSLLLIFIFTSVFAQQLPSTMGEVFFGFGGRVRRFGFIFIFTSVFAQQLPEVLTSYFYFYVCFRAAIAVVNGRGIFGIWRAGEVIWVCFFGLRV